MRTVIYHSGALGDFVTILPMVAGWRSRHPDASIHMITRMRHGELAAAAGVIDSWWDIDSAEMAPLFLAHHHVGLNRKLQLFDSAFVFASSSSPVLFHMHQADIPSVYDQPPFPTDREHIVEYHLKLLPFESGRMGSMTPLCHNRFSPEGDSLRKEIIIHPGSGSRRKNWPLTHFLQLADYCRGMKSEISWILGPAEDEMTLPSQDRIVQTNSLVELAQNLCGARFFIGNDSGVSQLSAFLGVRSVILFGASDWEVWAPRAKHVRILRGRCHHAPCHPGAPAEECDGRCMSSISPQRVIDSIERY
ncbi:MAG: glycosyltransferase family 9 protein [Chitinivibrionales bacterium]